MLRKYSSELNKINYLSLSLQQQFVDTSEKIVVIEALGCFPVLQNEHISKTHVLLFTSVTVLWYNKENVNKT